MSLPLIGKVPENYGAECGRCALAPQPWVPCAPPISGQPRIFIVGEGPGKAEVVKATPFSGETGRHLNDLIFWVASNGFGLDRSACHITNATGCLPLKHMSSKDWSGAVDACRGRLAYELADVPQGALILAMGQKVIQSMTGKNQVKDWRGYPLPGVGPFEHLNGKATIYPMYHPAFVLRTPAALPVEKIDIVRAMHFHLGHLKPWVWPRIAIHEGAEMWSIMEEIEKAGWMGVDVETAGQDPYTSPLLCLGLAHEEGAVSMIWPSLDKSLSDYARFLLKSPKVKKVFQNGNYDMISLQAWAVECSGNDFDTLVAHRITAPQMPHDLGFIASLEFAAERWKSQHKVGDDRKGSARWRVDAQDVTRFEALRSYNAKDALMTVKLRRPLLRRMGVPA